MNFLIQLVQEMLPDFKEGVVLPKDSLDVYTEHRLLLEARNTAPGAQNTVKVNYAPELMRRL